MFVDGKSIWLVKKSVPVVPRGYLLEQVGKRTEGESAGPGSPGKWQSNWIGRGSDGGISVGGEVLVKILKIF